MLHKYTTTHFYSAYFLDHALICVFIIYIILYISPAERFILVALSGLYYKKGNWLRLTKRQNEFIGRLLDILNN